MNFKILIDKCSGMYFINFSFTISREESVHVVRMKPANPRWQSPLYLLKVIIQQGLLDPGGAQLVTPLNGCPLYIP